MSAFQNGGHKTKHLEHLIKFIKNNSPLTMLLMVLKYDHNNIKEKMIPQLIKFDFNRSRFFIFKAVKT